MYKSISFLFLFFIICSSISFAISQNDINTINRMNFNNNVIVDDNTLINTDLSNNIIIDGNTIYTPKSSIDNNVINILNDSVIDNLVNGTIYSQNTIIVVENSNINLNNVGVENGLVAIAGDNISGNITVIFYTNMPNTPFSIKHYDGVTDNKTLAQIDGEIIIPLIYSDDFGKVIYSSSNFSTQILSFPNPLTHKAGGQTTNYYLDYFFSSYDFVTFTDGTTFLINDSWSNYSQYETLSPTTYYTYYSDSYRTVFFDGGTKRLSLTSKNNTSGWTHSVTISGANDMTHNAEVQQSFNWILNTTNNTNLYPVQNGFIPNQTLTKNSRLSLFFNNYYTNYTDITLEFFNASNLSQSGNGFEQIITVNMSLYQYDSISNSSIFLVDLNGLGNDISTAIYTNNTDNVLLKVYYTASKKNSSGGYNTLNLSSFYINISGNASTTSCINATNSSFNEISNTTLNAYAYSTGGGNVAEYANDRNYAGAGSIWQASVNSYPGWYALINKSLIPFNANRLTIMQYDGSRAYDISSFKIQGSNDSTNGFNGVWTNLTSSISPSSQINLTYYFNNTGTYNGYRVYIISGAGNPTFAGVILYGNTSSVNASCTYALPQQTASLPNININYYDNVYLDYTDYFSGFDRMYINFTSPNNNNISMYALLNNSSYISNNTPYYILNLSGNTYIERLYISALQNSSYTIFNLSICNYDACLNVSQYLNVSAEIITDVPVQINHIDNIFMNKNSIHTENWGAYFTGYTALSVSFIDLLTGNNITVLYFNSTANYNNTVLNITSFNNGIGDINTTFQSFNTSYYTIMLIDAINAYGDTGQYINFNINYTYIPPLNSSNPNNEQCINISVPCIFPDYKTITQDEMNKYILLTIIFTAIIVFVIIYKFIYESMLLSSLISAVLIFMELIYFAKIIYLPISYIVGITFILIVIGFLLYKWVSK